MSTTDLIFYNIFICLAIGIIGFIYLYHTYKRYNKNDTEVFYFTWAWLVTGLLWLAAGIGVIFYWQGLWLIDYLIFQYVVELFVALTPTAFMTYACQRIFHNRLMTRRVIFIYLIGSVVYYISSLYFKIQGPFPTHFGGEYIDNDFTNLVFKIMYYPLAVLIFYLFLRHIIDWIKKRKIEYPFRFSAAIAMVLYTIAGYFEEMGLFLDWQLFLARLFVFLAIIIGYLSYHYTRIASEKMAR